MFVDYSDACGANISVNSVLSTKRFYSLQFLRNVKSEIQGMWIDKLEMCNASYHYPITLESSMMIRDNVQYLNFTAIVNTPFGQNQFVNIYYRHMCVL
jgi:hypothetical protein